MKAIPAKLYAKEGKGAWKWGVRVGFGKGWRQGRKAEMDIVFRGMRERGDIQSEVIDCMGRLLVWGITVYGLCKYVS